MNGLVFGERGQTIVSSASSMCCTLETMGKEGNQIDENFIGKGDGEKGV